MGRGGKIWRLTREKKMRNIERIKTWEEEREEEEEKEKEAVE